jgi:multiple sugar transport system permease protein
MALSIRTIYQERLGSLFPLALIAPVAIVVAVWVILPLVHIVSLGFYDYSPYLARAMSWVRFGNYARIWDDPDFWHSLRASVIWVVGSVVPQFLLGLVMALLLNEAFRGRGLVRTILLAPWAVSGVVAGTIWLWLFDGSIGIINDVLLRLHIVDFPIPWGIYPETAWLMVLIANAWRGAPFFAIVLLAALQSIDASLYESAKIDGASTWQRFRFITLPSILGAVVLTTLLRALWTFNFVDLVWTMTRGGPINATKTLPIYIFEVSYQKGDFGYAAALSTTLCLMLLIFTLMYWQLNRLVK